MKLPLVGMSNLDLPKARDPINLFRWRNEEMHHLMHTLLDKYLNVSNFNHIILTVSDLNDLRINKYHGNLENAYFE